MFIKFYFIILFFATLGFADDINEQIEALKSAKGHERVEMMNRIKTQIATMNEDERAKTLQALQENINQGATQSQNYRQRAINQDRFNNIKYNQIKNIHSQQQNNQGAK